MIYEIWLSINCLRNNSDYGCYGLKALIFFFYNE